MPIEVKRWKCKAPKCDRVGTNKAAIERHEGRCWKNLDNHTCKTCAFKTESTSFTAEIPSMICTKGVEIPYNIKEMKQGVIFNCPLWEIVF